LKGLKDEKTYLITSLEGSSTVEKTEGVATSFDLLLDLLGGASEVRVIGATGNGAAGIRAGVASSERAAGGRLAEETTKE